MCFVVAVVPDSVAVVVCGSSASGRVGTYLTNKFVLLRIWRAPCCWLLIDHLFQWFFLFWAHFYFPTFGHTSRDHRCRPLPPVIAFISFLRIRSSTLWSLIFHRVLLTHALALSASQLVHKKSPTKIIRVRTRGGSNSRNWPIPGSRITWYATGAVSDIEPVAPVVLWGYTINISVGRWVEKPPRCELYWLFLFAEINEEKRIN